MARPPGHGRDFEPRRQEIIARAAALFAQRGYAATSITDLCDAVGLQRGALYYYIGSKEKLLVEIQAAVLGPLLEVSRRIVDAPASPAARLRMLSEVLLSIIVQRLDHIWVYEHDYRQLSAKNRAAVVAQRHEFESIIVDLVSRAVTAGQFREVDPPLAMLQFLNLHNHTYQWVKPDGRWSAHDLSVEYCATLFRGFAHPGWDPVLVDVEIQGFRRAHPEFRLDAALSSAA